MENSLKFHSNLKKITLATLLTIPVFLGILPLKDKANANPFSDKFKNLKAETMNHLTQNLFPSEISMKRKYVDELKLNTSSEYYTYCFKSEIEGIKDAIKVSKTKDLEEAWVFIPKMNLWVEIGIESVSGEYKKEVFSNKPLVESLINKYDHLVFYHTHPLFEDFTKKVSKEIAVRPSFQDLSWLERLANRFYSEHAKGKLEYRICSPYGVTEIQLKEENKDNLEKISYDYKGIAGTFREKTNNYEGSVFNFSSRDFIFMFYPWKVE